MNNKLLSSIIVITFSFLISIIISSYNLHKFDKIVEDKRDYHQMIKFDAYRYMSHAAEIKKDLEDGKNFFETGREHFTKYLPPRIAATIFYFFDIDLFKDFEKKEINTGVYKPYLFIQCLVYYLSLLVFIFLTKNLFSKKFLFFLVLFLSLEPNIIQYHGTFWSESYFFSFQIIIIGLILSSNKNYTNYFLTGFFIGLLSLQKQYAIYLVLPLILYFYLFYKKKIIINTFILLVGFFITQIFVGYNNYKRAGVFYFFANDNNLALHLDLVPKVVNQIKGYKNKEFITGEAIAMEKWLKENSIEFKEDPKNNEHYMFARDNILNEKDKLKFDQEIRERTIYYFKKYPVDFIKIVIKHGIHTVLLNPFHIYSDHNFKSGEIYYFSEKHDQLVKYRIIYTLIVYCLCFYGFIYLIKEKNYKLLTLLMFSILYFYSLCFWHGNTRYFMPVYLYFSFFFAKSFEIFSKKIEF